MQPTEILDFFFKQASRAEGGLSSAKVNGNYELFALNARQLFKSQLMQTLVRWRLKENPLPHLEVCLVNIFTNAELLVVLDETAEICSDLPIEKAMILAFLNDRKIDLRIDFSSVEVPERLLDYLLALTLFSGSITEEIQAEISRKTELLANNSKCILASNTYQTYFEILSNFFKKLPFEDFVSRAEELFKRRANDSFYSGSEQTEGGGQDNQIVLDYRLAAIFKKIGYTGVSVHRWR